MKCAECDEDLTSADGEIRCPACGWKPTDLLEAHLIRVRREHSDLLLHGGIGMVDVLSKLGIIDGAVTQGWIRRFYEARGVELTPVEAHISFPLGPATAMEVPPSSEPGETDE